MSDINNIFDPESERLDVINENLRLIQKKNGLVFGTDAYMLSAYVDKKPGSVAAELGCGTGVASLLLLTKGKASFVHAFEVQEAFSELTERNARLNALDGKLKIYRADIRDVSAGDVGCECDLVICNPPYMTTDCGKRNLNDEKYIARHEVYGGIKDFCLSARRLLKSGGSFYCVYRPDRLAELFSAMKMCSIEPKLMTLIHGDGKSRASMVLVKAKKDGGESLTVTRPLFIYRRSEGGPREMTDDAKLVYDTCSFEHIKNNT